MNVHKNARLTPRGRERIVRQVESGQTLEAVAEAAGVCPRTVRKWLDRYRREGLVGLQDRSSRPHRLRQPTPAAMIEEIERLRRERWTGKQIAVQVGVSPATVSRVLRRLQIGCGDAGALGGEPLDDGEADPAGAAGDEGAQPCQPVHQNGNTALHAAMAASGSPLGTTSKVSCLS